MNSNDIPSNLSNPAYLYDLVVATTEKSINGTMMEYIAQLTKPVCTVCYIADVYGNPIQIEYDVLLSQASGSDPFVIPDGTDVETSQDIKNLESARFLLGFRIRLGLPHVPDPSKLPDIVQLGNSASSITFNMYCATFQIVQYTPPNPYVDGKWMSLLQNSSDPWVFTSSVDLHLELVSGSAYDTLPPDIQRKIRKISSDTFSVQQMLFNFSDARLESLPDISSDITPGSPVDVVLREHFLGAYFAQLQADGQPMLGCSIVASGTGVTTLKPTSLDLMVNPFLDDQGRQVGGPFTTLNYLCAIGGKRLPSATNFSWNWVPDAAAQRDHHGVIAINRDTLADFFRSKLLSYAQKNCIEVWTWCGFEPPNVVYKWSLTRGQMPTVSTPATGDIVLRYDWTSKHSDKSSVGAGYFEMANFFTMTVQFTDQKIVITQKQVLYIDVWLAINNCKGNVVDKTITDTYYLGINEYGSVVTELGTQQEDNSQRPDVGTVANWFADINSLMAAIENSVYPFASTGLQDIPVSIIQDFVFPGGRTFVFKNVGFSDYQDLVSYITYAEPSTRKVQIVPAKDVKKVKARATLPEVTVDSRGESLALSYPGKVSPSIRSKAH